MNELEKACARVFGLIMIGLGFILWLQLQGCDPQTKICLLYTSDAADER